MNAEKDTLTTFLERGEKILLLPGGMREVAISDRDVLDIYSVRSGFCKLAIEHNAPVIPIFANGEHKTFKTFNLFPSIRQKLLSVIRYPFPTVFLGPLPCDMTVHIGDPIYPVEGDTPETLHARFYTAFAKLVLKYGEEHEHGEQIQIWLEKARENLEDTTLLDLE